jgi:hypothetical protein
MKQKDEILKTLQSLKPSLSMEYKVKDIGLFGSALDEKSGPDSDIDILVEFKEAIGFFKFLELEEYLSQQLGGRVDLVSRKALKPFIGRVILDQVVMA